MQPLFCETAPWPWGYEQVRLHFYSSGYLCPTFLSWFYPLCLASLNLIDCLFKFWDIKQLSWGPADQFILSSMKFTDDSLTVPVQSVLFSALILNATVAQQTVDQPLFNQICQMWNKFCQCIENGLFITAKCCSVMNAYHGCFGLSHGIFVNHSCSLPVDCLMQASIFSFSFSLEFNSLQLPLYFAEALEMIKTFFYLFCQACLLFLTCGRFAA